MSIKPFDDDNGSFLVSVSDEEQCSVRPTFAGAPAGWRVITGEAGRGAAWRDRIELNWPRSRVKNLRALAPGRGVC